MQDKAKCDAKKINGLAFGTANARVREGKPLWLCQLKEIKMVEGHELRKALIAPKIRRIEEHLKRFPDDAKARNRIADLERLIGWQ